MVSFFYNNKLDNLLLYQFFDNFCIKRNKIGLINNTTKKTLLLVICSKL